MNKMITILVVDDDEQILELFRDVIGQMDSCEVLTAMDGAAALDICRCNNVDFCFTDLKMPIMDGIEFSRNVRGLDNTIPVVAMTGCPSADDAIRTLKTGVADFLVKPFSFADIERSIRRTLEKRDSLVENMLRREEIKGRERLAALGREVSEKARDLKTLNKILQTVEWPSNGPAIFDLLVRLSVNIAGGGSSCFYVFDHTTKSPILVSVFDRSEAGAGPAVLSAIEEVLQSRIEEDLPILIRQSGDGKLSSAGIGSMIIVPMKIRGELFGTLISVIYSAHGQAGDHFTEKDLYYLDFMARRASFYVENFALYENIYESLFATLYALVDAIEARDPYTKQHSSRVTEVAVSIGRLLGCGEQQLGVLNFSGQLHDIGKIGVRDSILLKPGPLTSQERQLIEGHSVIGSNIVGHVGLMSEERRVIRCHHERWDGAGYPDGLKGDAIPLLARIIAVADAYDAMASDRAYRKRLAEDIVLGIIRDNSGSQFDPDIVKVFMDAYRMGLIGGLDSSLSEYKIANGALTTSGAIVAGINNSIDL